MIFPRVFIWRTNINQRGAFFALGDCHDFWQSSPQVAIHLFDRVFRRGNAGCGRSERSLFKFPLFATAILQSFTLSWPKSLKIQAPQAANQLLLSP